MASTFSDLLKIELIGDGEQSGSWGTTTNNNLSQSLEHSIAGVLGVNTGSSTAVTLTTGNGPQAQADNQARQASLIFSGASANCVVTVPATQKIYNVHNTNTSYTITLRLSGTSTDYVIPASSSALISTTGAAWHALSPGTFTAGGTISNTSGNITIDAVADIILDAGGNEITLKDDGTTFGGIINNSGELKIFSSSSSSGAFLTASGSNVTFAGTIGSGAITSTGAVTASGGVIVDNLTLVDGGNEIDVGSGNLVIDVAGEIDLNADGAYINLKDASTTYGRLFNNGGNLLIQSGTTTAATFNGANVTFAGTLASGAITSSGAITAGGDVTAFSDARLKTGIRNIDNALNMVGDMRGVYFIKDGEAGTGVIAQEVEKILPEVVKDGEYKSVAYGNMVGVLIEAIKELKKEVETLKESK
jgi:hypothetical protein